MFGLSQVVAVVFRRSPTASSAHTPIVELTIRTIPVGSLIKENDGLSDRPEIHCFSAATYAETAAISSSLNSGTIRLINFPLPCACLLPHREIGCAGRESFSPRVDETGEF